MKHRVLNNFTSTSFLIDHCEDYFAKDFNDFADQLGCD